MRWGCGAQLTGRNMRARSHTSPYARSIPSFRRLPGPGTAGGGIRKRGRPLATRKSASRGEFPLSDVLQNPARATMTSLESPGEYILEPRMTSTASEEEEYAF